MTDVRRGVPRTDVLLSDPRLTAAIGRLGRDAVKVAVRQAQEQARSGDVAAEHLVEVVLTLLPARATTLVPVLNATGVVLHTNLGRAPLSPAALAAMAAASSYVDLEYDVATGTRARRGRGTLAALRAAVPAADDALVVNNGAAALLLCTTALAGHGDVVVSRGEMVEIGDGFRLHELIASTGARVREVGTTNRTTLVDYADVVGSATGCVLKVHPSNFRVSGFTSSVGVAELAGLGAPVVVDVGSGLLAADNLLPDEPDVATALADGAALVTCSGDKLIGGPQAGLIFGRAELVERVRRHPLARALRVDKTTLAALEASVGGPVTPVARAIRTDPARLRERCQSLADAVGGEVVASDGAVGGGAAPGVPLPGWAVALNASYAERLRTGTPVVVGRVENGRTLLDLRCVPEEDDATVRDAVLACG